MRRNNRRTIDNNKLDNKDDSTRSKVNPSHYTGHKITPIDLIEEYDLNFKLGNVIKYVARHGEKDGRADLCKALWYLLRELKVPTDEIIEITSRYENNA